MLWRDMTFTDMAIRAGDNGPELACHRALLAKSSAALESMLSTAMVEGQTRHIVIRNASTETLRTFLEYIYTGETPDGLPVQTLGELVFLGNQYELTALAEDCAERLSAMLCPENVVAILQVLGRHETVSPSISTILNATSAKVSKDPDLMRAVVSQLCRMPNNL
ncbi:bath-42 [Symbiodinium sp. CCMP2592]|nr:bath-42 [Symbiodinium sp. CCMP2592]